MEKIKIIWTRQALQDVDIAVSYVALKREQSARFLAQRIEQAALILTQHPFIGRDGRVANTRELIVGGTPFIIPYQIKSEGVIILAVLHASRRWPKRIGS